MSNVSRDEFANRAFQLAYFIHREPKTAVEIASRALNKLQLAATAQGKRLYYRLTGRADARKARSKVSMGEPHLLQRLVYVESEEFERRKEAAAHNSSTNVEVTPAHQADLVVYFVKHLVRITTRRNSFYVTLGLSRLLYNYTTAETMELYNLVIQDPDRVHDDYYYRSRKAVLLKELSERFEGLLEVAKGTRGEQRWQPGPHNQQHHELVSESLRWFTPWSTPCVVPENLDPLNELIAPLNFAGRLADEEHEVEVNRIHATLHPECFARLAAANRLAPPGEKLELPNFLVNDDDSNNGNGSRLPPNLSDDDLETINVMLAHESARRKAAVASLYRVLVDGEQRAVINPAHSATTRLVVNDEAEVIEVYGSDEQGALLLGTHLLNFNGANNQTFSLTAEGGQSFSFTVNLVQDERGLATEAEVIVGCKVAVSSESIGATVRNFVTAIFGTGGWLKPAAALATLALLLAGGWWIWSNRQPPVQLVRVASSPTLDTSPIPSTSPDKLGPRTPTGRGPENQTAVPSPVLARREPDSTESVMRTIVPNTGTATDPEEAGTRGAWNPASMGKRLDEVRKIYLQPIADNGPTKELSDSLRGRLANGVIASSDADSADAALKISAQPAAEGRIVVVVRVVNANGYVIWPDSRRGSSWRYSGRPEEVANRIVNDLGRAVKR